MTSHRSFVRWVLLVGTMALGLTACAGGVTSGLTTSTTATGLVKGTLETVGGPAPGTPNPVNGTITLTNARGARRTTPAGSDGRFSVHVAPGTYRVSGTSPKVTDNSNPETCLAAAPVEVSVGKVATADVYCSIP